jgi:hypothetical protein
MVHVRKGWLFIVIHVVTIYYMFSKVHYYFFYCRPRDDRVRNDMIGKFEKKADVFIDYIYIINMTLLYIHKIEI